jgi:uncharacterized membrane protein YidH (DUF202 family)
MVDGPDLGYTNPRVIMIRRVKGIILIVLLLLMLVLMYIEYQSVMDQYSGKVYKPILPMEPILFSLLLMGFVMALVGIVFKAVEIKVSETGSQKYLLAHSSMKAALTTVIIALVFAILLYLIPTMPETKDILNSTDQRTLTYGQFTYEFASSDEFLISDTTAVGWESSGNLKIYGSVYPKNEFEQNHFDKEVPDSNSNITYPGGTTHFTYNNNGQLPYGKYILCVNNDNTQEPTTKFFVHRKIRDSFFTMLLEFTLMFLVLEAIWTAVTAAIKHQNRGDSIYK